MRSRTESGNRHTAHVKSRAVFALLLLIAIVSASGFGTAAAADKSATYTRDGNVTTVTVPDKVVLTYRAGDQQSAGDSEHADCRPGGARGGVDCKVNRPLGERKDGSAESQGAGATLTLPLSPRIPTDANDPYLRLDVGAPEFSASGLDSDVENRLRREAAMVRGRLSNWRHSLSGAQARTLRNDRAADMPITRVFQGLELFAAPSLVAKWTYAPYIAPPDLRFVVKKEDGTFEQIAAIPRGQPFYLEAAYSREPDGDERSAVLSWILCPDHLTVALSRTATDRKLYRSKPQIFNHVPETEPEGGHLSERAAYNWMYGHWDVEYRDRVLGPVRGRAIAVPIDHTGGLKSLEITFKHPRTGTDYQLWARTLEEIGDAMVFKFAGLSPPSGAVANVISDAARDVPPNEIAVPRNVTTVKASLDRADTSTGVVETEFRLDLKAELRDGAGPTESTHGWWRYSTPRDQIKLSRAGEYEPLNGDQLGVVKGTETWKRAPFTIETVKTLSFSHHQPIHNGQRILGRAWIEFTGTNLPVQHGRAVDIRFADEKLTFTGNHFADPRDPTRLKAEVAVKSGVDGSAKRVFLNDVAASWELGLPAATTRLRFARSVRTAEIDVIREIFLGEVFYVETAYREEPLTAVQRVKVTPQGGRAIDVTLRKLPDTPNILRSEPILLLDPVTQRPNQGDFNSLNANVGTNFPEGVDKIIKAAKGTQVVASRAGETGSRQQRLRATAMAAEPPPRRWQGALDQALECYGRVPGRFLITKFVGYADFIDTARKSLNRGSLSPFRRMDLTRDIEVKPESLAAAILLREELVKHLNVYRDKLQANRPTVRTMARMFASGRPDPLYAPLFLQKIERGLAASEGTMSGGAPGIDTQINLADAFGAARYFMVTDASGKETFKKESYRRFIDLAVDEAWRETQDHVAATMRTARDTPACEVEDMIKLSGWGVDPVVRALLPTLMRPPTGEEPRYPRILPDELARRWVKSQSVLGQSLRAQGAYANLNTDVIMMVAMAVSLGGSASLSLSTVLGIDAVTVIDSWNRYLRAMNEATFAEGLTPIGGEERLKAARAEAQARLFAAAANSVGAGVSGSLALYVKLSAKGVAPTQQALDWAIAKGAKASKRDPGLKSLSDAERKVLQYAEGRALEKQRLGQALDATDRQALELRKLRRGDPATGPPADRKIADAGRPPGDTADAPPGSSGVRPASDQGPSSGGRSDNTPDPAGSRQLANDNPGASSGSTGSSSPSPSSSSRPGSASDSGNASVGDSGRPPPTAGTQKFPDPKFGPVKETNLPPRPAGTEKFPDPKFSSVKDSGRPPAPVTNQYSELEFKPLKESSLPSGQPGTKEFTELDVQPLKETNAPGSSGRPFSSSSSRPGSSAPDSPAPGNIGMGGPRQGLEVLPLSRLDIPGIDTTWEIVEGTVLANLQIRSPLGTLTLKPGRLAQGGFADVYELLLPNGKQSGFVIKLYSRSHGRFSKNPAYTQFRARLTVEETQHGAGLLSARNINQIELQSWGSIPGQNDVMFVVQRQLGHHKPPGIDKEVTLMSLAGPNPRTNPKRFSKDVQNVVLELFHAMKRKNLAWEDLHWGNVVVQFDENGKPVRAAVIDHDRIADFGVSTRRDVPVFYDRLDDIVASPESNYINSMLSGRPFEDANAFMAKALENKGYIRYSKDWGFTDGIFDMEVVCKHPGFNNLHEWVPDGWEIGNACRSAQAAARSCPIPLTPLPRRGPGGTQHLSPSDMPHVVPPPGQQGFLQPLHGGARDGNQRAAAEIIPFPRPAAPLPVMSMRRRAA
ncbi:MAG: hypothetical protein MJE12_02875 [Alphaproteobacteria bacterium]|nr:hypothetical protein [Alphaproteobacteria bacterium]